MSSPRDHAGSDETEPKTEPGTALYDTPRPAGHDDFKHGGDTGEISGKAGSSESPGDLFTLFEEDDAETERESHEKAASEPPSVRPPPWLSSRSIARCARWRGRGRTPRRRPSPT